MRLSPSLWLSTITWFNVAVCLLNAINAANGFCPSPVTKVSYLDFNGRPSFNLLNEATSANVDNLQDEAAFGLYEVQEGIITRRGEEEEDLMAGNHSPLLAHNPNLKGVGAGGGFGGASKGKKTVGNAALKAQGKAHAKVLRAEGVVRIDNILTESVVDSLKDYIFSLRETAEAEVNAGTVNKKKRFANVLLRKNRCDLTMPLGVDIIYDALNEALRTSPVGQTIQAILGKNAVLYELSCLISDPGSDRQVVHPDTPCNSNEEEPVLYTCFIALQDIHMDMGPTVWLPNTHNKESHLKFNDKIQREEGLDTPKDEILKTTPSVLGLLPKGSCGIFDSRLLHCGSANRSNEKRALFYFSFKNPKIGYPGNPPSIRPELDGKILLSTLEKELKLHEAGKPRPQLDALAGTLE